jgi:DNA-binding PadR family transcriptional regulator
MRCIETMPGINIAQIWKGVRPRGSHHIIYYRINTLEKAGLIVTKRGNRNERKCYVTAKTGTETRTG